MRKKADVSSNREPRHSPDKGAVDQSSVASAPGFSIGRDNEENFWETSDVNNWEKNQKESEIIEVKIKENLPKITEQSIKILNEIVKLDKDRVWEIVKASNSKRTEVLSEDELKELFNRATAIPLEKTISFKELMTQEFPPARYVIEPFFEVGAVNMLSAPPNNWKSWFLFYFASCIAQGDMVFKKFPVEKCGVLIVNEEDSHRSVQDRFKILKITDQSLEIYFRIASGAKLTKEFILEVIEECKQKNLGMVMFDSLRSMHEADENDSTTMQVVMDYLKVIAREGITVLFTHHNRKKSMFSKGDDAEASRGSSAINAAVSGYVSLEEEQRENGTFVIVRHLKSKVGEKLPTFEIKVIKEDNNIEFNYEGEFKSGEGKLIQTKESIMGTMQVGDLKTVNDFIAMNIASKSVIRAALNALIYEGILISMTRSEAHKKGLIGSMTGSPREKLYSLPSEESELVQEEFDNF